MELDEEKRHQSEVRWWLERIREQPVSERRAYWLKWRAAITRNRGLEAGQRIHEDVIRSWRSR